MAALLVAIPLLAGIAVLGNALQSSATTSLTNSTRDEARRLLSEILVSGPVFIEGSGAVDEGFVAQVVDPSTDSVIATWNRNVMRPIAADRPPTASSTVSGDAPWLLTRRQDLPQYLVVATGFTYQGHDYVLLTASPQEVQRQFVTRLVEGMIIAVPAFMLLVGLSTNVLVRRSLSPVREITERVSGITNENLDERVPVPQTDDEIAGLAETMNSMLERLAAGQKAQRRFVSDASHELRSPLTTIKGALEIGQASDDPEVWSELAPLMSKETDRLNTMVGDLLLLSRIDDRGARLNLADVDLDDLVDAEVRRLKDTSDVRVLTQVEVCRVTGDRDRLAQTLRNLVDNAVRHATSTIRIGLARTPGDGARLWVEDDGHGIDPEDRERVFQRFVRLDESRTRDAGGSGLGLAIASELVAAHHGRISVTDSRLGGASFVVELPASPAAGGPTAS